jgi:diguanylate cyclase (GGDEF)-like protein
VAVAESPPPKVADSAALAEIARIATDEHGLRATLQRIVDALVRLYGWELVALVRVERETNRFVCEALHSTVPTDIYVGYSRELGSGVVGRVAQDGVAIVVDDAETCPDFVHTLPGARAEICVPIRHRGEVVGILNVESCQVGAFHDSLPLLEAIAGQVAGAIAMARLYAATQWRARAAEIEAEVVRLVALPADFEHRLERVAAYLRETFDFLMVAMVLCDDEGEEWVHRAFATRMPTSILRTRWPTSAGVVGRAIRAREPQLVLDVRADPDYFGVFDECRAELAVPLWAGDRLLGAINYEADDAGIFRAEIVTFLTRLADRVAGSIELALANRRLLTSQQDLADAARRLEAANAELRRLTLVDGLTGVANRRCFDERFAEEWRRAARRREPLAVGFIDVDCFKPFNDTRGHQQGDECLRMVAQILAAGVSRAGELVARWGGEEFVVLLPGASADQALATVERLRAEVEAAELAHPASTVGPVVTVSAGVAATVADLEQDPAALLRMADDALYAAKNAGRNRVGC